ncbi:MAG: hypothetical protein COB38_05725 [Gammaproteobacteria bacterium]|nr:MAG: hypothetical protein COB38_05725 [Gammaproteobacteria bacterium]
MEENANKILELSPMGIIITDKNTRMTWCNDRFLNDSGLNKNDIINRLFASLPIEGDGFSNDASKSINLQLFNTNTQIRKSFQYWQVSLADVNQQRIHYFILQQEASSLTNSPKLKANIRLPKRANWLEFLDYEVSRSRRYNNPLSLMKCHLLISENPQSIDEDDIQACVKNTLMDELRWADMIGNTQQGSYLMVLPETPQESTTALQEKLQEAISSELKSLSANLATQLVFGVAHWEKHDDSSTLLEKARKSLVVELEALLP